jgi:uncharacterized protein (TIGR03435 family)
MAVLLVAPDWAQAPPGFDVVSIKPADPSQFPSNIDEEDPCSATRLQRTGRALSGGAVTLYSLIALAYNPWQQSNGCAFAVRSNLISGGPGWIRTQRYAVQAVMPVDADADGYERLQATGDDVGVQRMLQTMLAERFALAVRRETRELPVYFMELDEDLTTSQRRMSRSLSANQSNASSRYGQGIFSSYPTSSDGGRYVSIAFNRQSMTQVAQRLGSAAQRPVFDRTGLGGAFDFVLEYDETGAARPTLFTAARDQLGLRLRSGRAPVTALVVDRAERPSAN